MRNTPAPQAGEHQLLVTRDSAAVGWVLRVDDHEVVVHETDCDAWPWSVRRIPLGDVVQVYTARDVDGRGDDPIEVFAALRDELAS